MQTRPPPVSSSQPSEVVRRRLIGSNNVESNVFVSRKITGRMDTSRHFRHKKQGEPAIMI